MKLLVLSKNYRILYPLVGSVLGLGSPAGCLALRRLFSADAAPLAEWIGFEVQAHLFFYAYQTIGTVLIFFLAGLWTGRILDRLDKLSENRRELALRDPLTGLYNRRYLTERLVEEMARASRQNQPLSYLMVDIDHFKRLNDHYGHLAGDAVLKELAERLRQACREMDVVGRFGGEEFFVILPGTDNATAAEIAERIRSSVEEKPFSAGTFPLDVQVSVGGAQRLAAFSHVNQLIDSADRALYAAKAAGRNRVVLSGDWLE